ncbi:MAG: hypothetical protein ORN98_06235 [Alphaproteobacteria bacterium]|nr:hypothetical protein [Alphaproteobacteria bacterium]
MTFDWKSIIGTVAPGLATALGGPLAGMAVSALSTALLGKPDGTVDDVAKIVTSGNPELLLKIKQVDLEFQQHMADVGLDLQKIAARDRGDARAREIAVKDKTPHILAYSVTVGFFVMLLVMSFADIAIANRDLLNVMLGALGAAWASIMSYFFGSSAGSQDKNQMIGQILTEKSGGKV